MYPTLGKVLKTAMRMAKRATEQRRRPGYLPFMKMRTRRSGVFSGRTCLLPCPTPPYAHKIEWHIYSISTAGASEYKLNNRVVTYTAYSTALTSHNILVKARNFLVFQGDVEAVASQSPVVLSKLVDQISGSLELKAEYDKCKEEMENATERATENFGKRRGIAGGIKTYKEQKGEAEIFEGLLQERVCVYRLYWRKLPICFG